MPHSEIPGSKPVCGSPRLIAACHVLHRLSVPRHPPSTLSSLTIKCLDLMRSQLTSSEFSCVFSTTRIQLSTNFGSRGSDAELARFDASRANRCISAMLLDSAKNLAGSIHRCRSGGADRDRTDDLRLAKPALSQLSYSPGSVSWSKSKPRALLRTASMVVGLGRFELPTSRLSGVRSNQLSYRPRCV